jgi:hypothetical protein
MRTRPRFLAAPLSIAALLISAPAWSAGLQGTCTPGATTLCLLSNRIQVEVDWQDSGGQTGDGQVVPFATSDTGFFWFADPLLIDHYVKVIDGTTFNDHFWVFFASLTNVEYTLTVTDTVGGSQAVYTNELGTFTSLIDLMAIEVPPTLALRGTPPETSRPADLDKAAGAPDKGASGSCVPGDTVLCLDEGRFRVEVTWDSGTSSGSGQAEPLTDNSGYYWFFTPSSTELTVKVQAGDNGNFWFFYGAVTEVEYQITVTDTCSGAAQTYFNPQGNLTSAGDFTAFPLTLDCLLFPDGFESGDTSRWTLAVGEPE